MHSCTLHSMLRHRCVVLRKNIIVRHPLLPFSVSYGPYLQYTSTVHTIPRLMYIYSNYIHKFRTISIWCLLLRTPYNGGCDGKTLDLQ